MRSGTMVRGVSVLHPVKPPFADHHIRITVELQERRDRLHAILDVAIKHDPALADEVVAEQDVAVVHLPGEQEPPTDPADGNAVRAVVTGVDVVLALGIVELRRAGFDDHVARRPLSKNRCAARLVAAAKANRVCRGVELDPLYVDVIVRRYEAATGNPAVLVETGEAFDLLAGRRAREAAPV